MKLKFIVLFLLCAAPAHAVDGLYNADIGKYPALSAWAADTGGLQKACAPASWGYLSRYVPPNVPNLLACLGNQQIDIEVREILNEGPKNSCFTLAVIYAMYQIMGTDVRTGETDGWWLSQPLVKGVWSGDQIRPGEDVLGRVAESAGNGFQSILWANGDDYDHVWLVTGMSGDMFEIFPGKVFDFYNGDFGVFEGISRDMNFCNLRILDGSRVETPEEIYGGGGGGGGCFFNSFSD